MDSLPSEPPGKPNTYIEGYLGAKSFHELTLLILTVMKQTLLVPGGGEGLATHFSVLAWRIPQTEEPGRLQSMGSQRVRHN